MEYAWVYDQLEAAHIISYDEKVPGVHDESSIWQRTGLTQMHQVQNGLLLCKLCKARFNCLTQYVEVVDDNLVIKVVGDGNDKTNTQILILRVDRTVWARYWSDGRKAVEDNGDMALYFVQQDPLQLPNRQALAFHKIACLIWEMAGGVEPDEEFCSDDDDLYPVDTAALKRRFNIQDSA